MATKAVGLRPVAAIALASLLLLAGCGSQFSPYVREVSEIRPDERVETTLTVVDPFEQADAGKQYRQRSEGADKLPLPSWPSRPKTPSTCRRASARADIGRWLTRKRSVRVGFRGRSRRAGGVLRTLAYSHKRTEGRGPKVQSTPKIDAWKSVMNPFKSG